MKFSLAIPIYNPIDTSSLEEIVRFFHEKECLENSNRNYDLIIVNDGCNEFTSRAIGSLSQNFGCCTRVLVHTTNQGKGAAIKSAIALCLEDLKHGIGPASIIFADSDGQHSVKDIERIINHTILNPGHFIIGTRVMSSNDAILVPLKSRIGRSVIGTIMKIFTQRIIRDSQSGLRSIPSDLFELGINIPENRYDYETRFILELGKTHVPINEIPIETIYENNNVGTKFRPLIDSARILFTFVRVSSIALVSTILDLVTFACLSRFGLDTILSATISKTISGCFYLVTIAKYGFIEGRKIRYITKYKKIITLQVANILLEPQLVVKLDLSLQNPILSKVIVDTSIFFLNFFILRFVFTKLSKT